MSWKDRLRPASFRGAPYFVEVSRDPAGRRKVVHEYPLRAEPYVEDLGPGIGPINQLGYVIGPDYMDARDVLIAALDKPGPGQLVHPYFGEMQVDALLGPVTQSLDFGGMATFDLTYFKSGPAANPQARTDTAAAVSRAADQAHLSNITDLVKDFDVLGAASWVTDQAVALVNDGLGFIDGALAALPIADAISTVADVANAVLDIRSAVIVSIRNPLKLGRELTGAIAGIGSATTTPLGAFREYERFFKSFDNLVPGTSSTGNGAQAAKNVSAWKQFMQTAATVEMARQISGGTPFENGTGDLDVPVIVADQPVEPGQFDSADQAVQARDNVLARLDLLMNTAGDDVFNSLLDLRASVIDDVRIRAAQLPSIRQYYLPSTTSSLVLAHRLYGDAERAKDLVARNNVKHPGFIPGGQSIEVLIDAS